jgi:hypothetical protein
MRKILLASVAAIPLLSISMLPVPAQELREKSGSSMSQSQGAEPREKGSVQGRTEQSRPKSGGESAAKVSGSQDRTEGRASSGSGEEHTTVGQAPAKANGSDNRAGDSKSQASDRSKADQGRAKDTAKSMDRSNARSMNQAKSKDSADQAKSNLDQAKSKSQGQSDAKGKDQNEDRSKIGSTQGKGNQTTGANDTQKQAPTTTGQAPRSNDSNARNEQSGRNSDATREGQNDREPQNNRNAQSGRSEQGGSQSLAERSSVTLTEEQRTKLRETILSGRDVPRVDRVNFEIEVGRPVPREVRIREVPTTLVEIYPEWRGDEYFVVNDEIVIVDRSRRIVSRVPVSASSASVETRRSSSTSMEVTNSPDEIRRVQEILIERGFYKGRPDGAMSVEFKDALISFQRREGIEVTGRIDQRTATSLGVSIRTEGQAGGREDGNRSGQQGARDNEQKSDQKSGQNNPANNAKPATSGQAGNVPNSGQSKPSTSGQGGNAQTHGSANDPNQKSENAPSGQTGQERPSTSGQGGSTNQNNPPSQGGPSFKPTNPSTPNQPSGQGRDGANEQRKQP